jgi:hypothetical protein
MKPLVFLTLRTFVNGVKRAVTNPRRLVALLFAAFWLGRFVLFPTTGERRAFESRALNRATQMLPEVDLTRILDALVFAAFLLITFFLALGSLSTRNSFRPADVDVLFPTPVRPRLVLVFRVLRDYLLTLLAPIFFIIVGLRPAASGIRSLRQIAENPEVIQQTLRVSIAAWMLVAFCWVSINYAVSLFVNRSDLASTRNRRVLGWVLGIVLIGVGVYIAWQATTFQRWQDWVGLAENPALRAIFFTATLATWAVHGVVQGEVWQLVGGFGGMLAIIALSFKVSLSQSGWMYDQAAVRGFDSANARKLQQSGDTIGLMTAQARQGKVKAGRFKWLSNMAPTGARALLWKEALIATRSTWFLMVLFSIIAVFIALVPLLGGAIERREISGYMFLFMQSMGVFMSASTLAQAGFIEMLRRVDVQKPLPFSFASTITFEVLAKALPASLAAWVSSLIAIIVSPAIWQEALAGAILMPFLAILICLVTALTTILFPDFEDPSQRGFRGLMNFVMVVAANAPGVLAFIGLVALGSGAAAAALVAAGIKIGIGALVASVAGAQYAQFNPSE